MLHDCARRDNTLVSSLSRPIFADESIPSSNGFARPALTDCGVVVNPDTVRAQVESAVLFGISGAGEVTLNQGRIAQSKFHDYRVMRMNEMPGIQVHIVPSRGNSGGMGQPGTSPLASAVANAVFAATGTRIRKRPIANQPKKSIA
jgi:CO/xanthine dehydrogenase Mo-binding subunit